MLLLHFQNLSKRKFEGHSSYKIYSNSTCIEYYVPFNILIYTSHFFPHFTLTLKKKRTAINPNAQLYSHKNIFLQ